MEVFIHLGVHKTATTFFQVSVFPKIDGVVYLQRKFFFEFFDYVLFEDDYHFDPNIGLAIFKKLISNNFGVKPCLKVIISKEALYSNPYLGSINRVRNLNRLQEIFGKNLKLIISLRRQTSLLESLYLQYIKTGGTASPEEFMGYKKIPLNVNVNYFLFDRYLLDVQSRIGKENLFIFLHESFKEDKVGIINSIVFFMDAKLSGPVNVNGILNQSISSRLVFLFRFLNKFSRSNKEPFLFMPRIFFEMYLRIFIRITRIIGARGYKDIGFSDAEMALIKQSNLGLSASFPELEIKKFGYPV